MNHASEHTEINRTIDICDNFKGLVQKQTAKLRELTIENNSLRLERYKLLAELRCSEIEIAYHELQHRYHELQHRYQDLDSHYKTELGRRRSMQRSFSWKITIPLRFLKRLGKSKA